MKTFDHGFRYGHMPGSRNERCDADALAAKATAANVRSQLMELGFNPEIFDKFNQEIESLLAAQDIINLAKLLGKIYGCFCPEQYDNELNIEVTKQLPLLKLNNNYMKEDSLENYKIFCAFGTGGTSGGISKYMNETYGKKSVHVVFPSC